MVFEGSISLQVQGGAELKPTSHGGGSGIEEPVDKLSSVINRLNDRFGTDFTETDRLSYEQIVEDIINNEDLAQKAKNNTKENFRGSSRYWMGQWL